MKRLGLSQTRLQDQAKVEAGRHGLAETHKISDATISNIVNDKHGSVGMFTLMALAWAIGRPIEEVVTVAFQLEEREARLKKAEFFRLMDLLEQITVDEDRSYFTRQISNLARDMENAIENTPKKSRRSSG
jgi:transcriptional regulator with XRE-family HTH domain